MVAGTYGILYYDSGGKLLEVPSARVVFSYSHSIAPAQQQMQLVPEVASGAPGTTRAATPLAQPGGVPQASKIRRLAGLADVAADDDDDDDDGHTSDAERADDGQDRADQGDSGSKDAGGDAEVTERSQPAGESGMQRSRARARSRNRERVNQDKLERKQALRELRQVALQAEVQKEQTELLRSTVVNKELVEAHTMMAIHRKEVVEAQRIAATATKREWDRVERSSTLINAGHLDNLDTVQQASTKFLGILETIASESTKRLLAPPPAPPPATDWTAVIQSLIGVVGQVTMQVLPSHPRQALPKPATSDLSPATSQDGTTDDKSTEATAPPASAQTADKDQLLSKLAKRFGAVGEVELARRLSTPEGIAELLDELNTTLGES
jgi:hypothetical protein